MKIKNLKINKELIERIIPIAMIIGSISGTTIYYQYENKEQVQEITIDSNNLLIDENGNMSYYFDAGQHVIKVSRNDAYYHKSDDIEGYTIKEVEINSYKDNNVITYVNTEPVIVTATKKKNGQLKFDDFGTIATKNNTK